jgi:hypothetical protein
MGISIALSENEVTENKKGGPLAARLNPEP